jgi:hypothetical protein
MCILEEMKRRYLQRQKSDCETEAALGLRAHRFINEKKGEGREQGMEEKDSSFAATR